MSEQTQVNAAKVGEPLWVMTKDPKKVAAGKRLAEWNPKNREKRAQETKTREGETKLSLGQYYGNGLVIAVVVSGFLGCYSHESKKGDNNDIKVTSVETQNCTNKFEMEQSAILQNGQEEYH